MINYSGAHTHFPSIGLDEKLRVSLHKVPK
jgi:hypothetical protein